MTYLERIIQERVGTSTVTTLSRETERIAEEIAREILRDPVFRRRLRAFAKRAFENTLADLESEAPEPPENSGR